MDNRLDSLDLGDLTGNAAVVKRIGRVKKCRFCRTPLNMYNKSKDCHVHNYKGVVRDSEEEERKLVNANYYCKTKAKRARFYASRR